MGGGVIAVIGKRDEMVGPALCKDTERSSHFSEEMPASVDVLCTRGEANDDCANCGR